MTDTAIPTKKKTGKKFYIAFRGNPQLSSGGYHIAYGQITKKEAKNAEKPVYGSVTMVFEADTEEEYNKEIARLEGEGKKVNRR